MTRDKRITRIATDYVWLNGHATPSLNEYIMLKQQLVRIIASKTK